MIFRLAGCFAALVVSIPSESVGENCKSVSRQTEPTGLLQTNLASLRHQHHDHFEDHKHDQDQIQKTVICVCEEDRACKEGHPNAVLYNFSSSHIGKFQLALKGSHSVFQLEEVYTDVANSTAKIGKGHMMAALCNPAFRGTLIRDVLRRTVLVDGVPLAPHLSDKELEHIIIQRLVQDQKAKTNVLVGFQGLSSSKVILPDPSSYMKELEALIRKQHFSSTLVPDETLLVPVWSALPEKSVVLDDFEKAFSVFQKRYPQLCFKKVEVLAVLHVRPNVDSTNVLRSTEELLDLILHRISHHFKPICGNPTVTVASEPDTDRFMYQLLRRKYVLPVHHGLSLGVSPELWPLEMRQRVCGVRFLMLLGNEGTGHHGLTPAIRKILKGLKVLPENAKIGHDSAAHFQGDNGLSGAWKRGSVDDFSTALLQSPAHGVVQLAYSFPTYGRRSPQDTVYAFGDLHKWLQHFHVRSAVIKYERPFEDRVKSAFRRFPSFYNNRVEVCRESQRSFDKLFKTQMGGAWTAPVLKLRIEHLGNCSNFVGKLVDFLQQSNFLLPTEQVLEQPVNDSICR